MKPSIMQTLAVPNLGTEDPKLLIQAGKHPMNVLVRNTGGTLVFLAHNVNDLTDTNSLAGSYQLPPADRDWFRLAPGQSLIAAGQGGGGEVSIAGSEFILDDSDSKIGDA